MANTPTNSIVFPVYGQAFNESGVIRSAVTLNPLSGGLTGLAATISKNDGAFGSTTNAPVEIGTTGVWTLDLTAAEMSAQKILLLVVASNTNAITCVLEIKPLNMTEPTTSWDLVGQIRLENLLMNVSAACINANQMVSAGTQTIFTRGLVKMLQGTYTEQSGGTSSRGSMT